MDAMGQRADSDITRRRIRSSGWGGFALHLCLFISIYKKKTVNRLFFRQNITQKKYGNSAKWNFC